MKRITILTAFLAATILLTPTHVTHGEEPQPSETEKPVAKPPRIEQQIAKDRANLFNVEGKTLEDRQAAFREKLAMTLDKINGLLHDNPYDEAQKQLSKFKIDLLRYGVMVKYPDAPQKIDSFLNELKTSDQPELRQIAQREGLLYALDAYTSLSADEQIDLMQQAWEFIESHEPSSELQLFVLAVSRQIHTSQVPHQSAKIHEQIAAHFAQSDDEKLQKLAEKFRATALRLDLPGTPMQLTGSKADGTPFDLKELKGQVVLVDFWATWCGPCLAEFPRMLELYKQLKDQGFEIVGVSVDDNHDHLLKFLEAREIPWIVLHEELEQGESGWNHPAVKRYGIDAVPCMILIGRDGNVITTHARGEELEQHIEKLFPTTKETPSTES